MAKTRDWDSLELSVTIGTHIVTGFTDGSMLEITPDADVWSTSVDSDGNSSRHKINNNNYTVVMNLKQTSPTNDVLSNFYNLDRQLNTGSFPIAIRDNNGTSLITSLKAYVERVADATVAATTTTDRTWTIKITDAGYFVGGY